MKMPFETIYVSSKRITSILVFRVFLCLLFLKNNQPKIILIPKRHILRWQIVFPFSGIIKVPLLDIPTKARLIQFFMPTTLEVEIKTS